MDGSQFMRASAKGRAHNTVVDYLTVPGAQVTQAERKRIKDMAGLHPNGVLVNIGIMWGCTLWCLRAGAPKARLYGIDIAPWKWEIKYKDELDAILWAGDSHVVHKDFNDDINVLLIDGDHHYNSVQRDIAGWVPKCKGHVIFHDYAPTPNNLKQFPELAGVRKAVDEWFVTQVGWVERPAPDSLRIFEWQK
ncbi:hypothetical protein GF380_01520 [Candidatus Uhrbacteria bacterium]|nr:hypothetical protein [Candidatus Uhrbacteria bacterium]